MGLLFFCVKIFLVLLGRKGVIGGWVKGGG